MKPRLFPIVPILVAFLALALPPRADAVGVALTGAAGSTGLGGGVILGLTDRLNLRGELTGFPVRPATELEEVYYEFGLPTMRRLLLDFYPAGGFHLSVGGFHGGSLEAVHRGVAGKTVLIGDGDYDGGQVGTFTARLELGGVSPYFGLGFGNPVTKRVGVHLDIGAALLRTTPTVTFEATGPIADDPGFQAELASLTESSGEDLEVVAFYPVISLALTVGFGGGSIAD